MKKLLNEWRQYLDEEIYGNRSIVYHGTDSLADIESILTNGYSLDKNIRAMYGRGIYTVYDLEGTSTSMGGYGPMIIKFSVDMSGKHLILDYDQAKKVHGEQYKLEDQLKKFGLDQNLSKESITVVGPGTVIKVNKKNATNNTVKVLDIGIIGQRPAPQNNKINNLITKKKTLEKHPEGNIWIHYQITDEDGNIPHYLDHSQFVVSYPNFSYSFIEPNRTEIIQDEPITIENVPYKDSTNWDRILSDIKYIYDDSDDDLIYDNAYTADIAKKITELLRTKNNKITQIDSITFTGRQDGPVMLVYNPKKATMLGWRRSGRFMHNPMVGDIVVLDPYTSTMLADKLANTDDPEKFYATLKKYGIKRDSKNLKDALSQDKSINDTESLFKKFLEGLRGKIIKGDAKSGYIVDWEGEGTTDTLLNFNLLVVEEAPDPTEWVKDVNGKKILDYIEKQKRAPLP